MKKTSIKKTNQVLSVLLSSCMLLSATTAASATLVTDTTQNEQIQTNLPPEHTPKTWTLTHELGGPFNYVIMPGDSVVYKGETKHSIEKGLYGQDVAWTSVDAGFSIKKYDTTYLKSNLPEIEFTTTECRNYDSIDGENTQKGDMVKTNTGFTNNTGKILRLWCTGSGGIAGYNIWSAENNVVQVAGVVFREAYVTLEAYEPEYNFSYDLQGGTVQVENLPDKYYITNEDYTLNIPAPTMAGEHFYRWSGSIPWGNSATIYPTGKAKGQSYTDFTWSLDDNSLGTCDFKDSELVANYQPGFTMSFHGMKGTVNNQSDYIYEIDKEYNKEKDVTEYIGFDETDLDISRNGYTFAGWYLDSDYTRPFYGLNDDRTYDMNGDGVYDYKDEGEPFEGSNWNMDLYAKWESAKAPEITEGSKQTWIKASNEGASFRSDAEYDDFIKVTIDGADLSTENYTVESGSTIVKLKASYLETLTIGKHTIAIVSESGTAETEFSVETQKTDVDTTIAFNPGGTWILINPGNKVDSNHCAYGEVTLDSDQQYEIINEFWLRDDGKVNSSSGKHEYDIFESGRSYTYGMELKAKDGYKFNKTAKYLIKDSWHFEDIDDAICTVSEDESILTIKSMHTTTFESLDNYKVIDTIEVNNATLTFNVGDAPKFTGKEPENSKYSIVEYWRDNVNGEGICTSPFFNQAFEKHIEKFKSGVNYEYSIYFRIDGDAWEEGYRLADSVTIKINGKDIDFNIEDIDYNASVEAWTSNLISMTPTEVTQDNKVDTNIKITNTMLDIYPGNTPRGPLSDGTDAHGYGAKTNSEQYELTDEFWVRDDGKVNYYSDPYSSEGKNEYGTFEVGHSYTYGIELKAKSGYIFDKNAEYKVNVDGTDMTGTTSVVSEDGKTLTIKNIKTEEFKAPSADKEINTVKINNATLSFKVGDAPVFTGKIDNDMYYIDHERWDGSDNTGWTSSEYWNQRYGDFAGSWGMPITAFAANTEYTYGVYLKLTKNAYKEGYRFSKDANKLKLILNGQTINFSNPENDISTDNDDGFLVWFSNVLVMTPTQNSEPDNPSNPENPNKPGEPATPDKPSNPGEPATPDNPSTPSIPNNSSNQNGKVPQTGADNMIIWFTLGLISSTSIIAIAMYRKRKKSSK